MANANLSIHPRVENGRTVHDKVNTCLSPLKGKRERLIANIEAHLERHPNDGVSAARLSKLKAA